MLDESGGLAADKCNLGQADGFSRSLWLVCHRAREPPGRRNYVRFVIGGNYGATMGIEQIKDYQPPSDGDADKVKKPPPLARSSTTLAKDSSQ